VFVCLAHSFPVPSSIRPLDPERLRVLNTWYAISAPTYRLVWRVMPFLLALGMIVARRRGKSAQFWVLTGLLAHVVWNSVSFAVMNASLIGSCIAEVSPLVASRIAYITSISLEAVLLVAAVLVWRRLPSPRTVLASRRTDIVALVLAGACLLLSYSLVVHWGGRLMNIAVLEPTFAARASIGAGIHVVAPAILGALVLRLRSLVAREAREKSRFARAR
jgi:hypothetical protein